MEVSKGIDPSRANQKAVKRRSLFGGKTRSLAFAGGVVHIAFCVGHIEIASENHGLLQRKKMGLEVCVPLLSPVLETLKSITCVWHVDCDQVEVFEFHRD